MAANAHAPVNPPRWWIAVASGAIVGILGGLIGLGGAEFRLPVLLMLGFAALPAVILNKATSLVVVAAALLFRGLAVPFSDVLSQWPVIVNLLAGSLLGAWVAAGWATRVHEHTLRRVMAVLLLLIAAALMFGHGQGSHPAVLDGVPLRVTGVLVGFGIGVVASLLGVAGGELLIGVHLFSVQ